MFFLLNFGHAGVCRNVVPVTPQIRIFR